MFTITIFFSLSGGNGGFYPYSYIDIRFSIIIIVDWFISFSGYTFRLTKALFIFNIYRNSYRDTL